MDTSATTKQPKKRGPVASGHVSTHVMLPEDLIEWAKHQPEKLSGLVRKALNDERRRRKVHSV
jgi:hypothetical protein